MSSEQFSPRQQAEIRKHGDRCKEMRDILERYDVNVEDYTGRSFIGLSLFLQGQLKHQTGTVGDLVRGKRDGWDVRNIKPAEGEFWEVEMICVEKDQ